MRAWKHRDREVVHDTVTWSTRGGFPRTCTTTRCDFFVVVATSAWSEDATTCLACLSCPPPQQSQGEPGFHFAGLELLTFTNPCLEVPK